MKLSTIPVQRDDHWQDDPLALPIPAHIGAQFSLRYHVALEAMKLGKGNAAAAQALLEMVLAAGLLADCGHGQLDLQQTRAAEKAIRCAAESGLRSRNWWVSAVGFDALCAMLAEHDRQLSNACARDVLRALERVYQLSQRAGVLASKSPSRG